MRAHLFLALLAVCVVPSMTSAQTAEEIIARNIAARGGAEKFLAIHSMVVRTEEDAHWDGKGTSVLRIMRPDRMRFDETWRLNPNDEPVIMIRGFDGQTGWATVLAGRRQWRRTMTGAELEAFREAALNKFEESLSGLQAKGNQVELVGMETVDRKPCYKIRFTSHTGRVRYSYYDAESFLVVRNDEVLSKSGSKKKKLLTTATSDYRSVNGMLFPYSFITISSYLANPFASAWGLPNPPGGSLWPTKRNSWTSTIEAIEINPVMDEGAFEMPATIRRGL